MCMMSKHLVRSGLVSGCLVAAAVIMGAARGTRAQGTVSSPAADTAHDSLLVSDSVYRGWKWFHVYCFRCHGEDAIGGVNPAAPDLRWALSPIGGDRKSTRLNSSHLVISYAVFCLKKKKKKHNFSNDSRNTQKASQK